MADPGNRTFICSVVFIDLVAYTKRPVSEQIRVKASLTNNLSESIKDIPPNDRIILDTGDGAAISFLGDPEDALFVTLSLREAMLREGMTSTMIESTGEDSVRMGINLGPVKLVRDINGHPNIIGDGINVAQRIMSFARPGQIVVSRSYYDVVSNLASEYAKLFKYEGSRTDKHVREHEIYIVGQDAIAFEKARSGMKDRAVPTDAPAMPPPQKISAEPGTTTVTLTIPSFTGSHRKLGAIAGGIAAVVVVLATLLLIRKPEAPTLTAAGPVPKIAQAPAPVAAAPVEPAAASPATAQAPPPTTPDTGAAKPATPQATTVPPTPAAAPGKADPAKAEPAKAEPAKTEPAKPDLPPGTVNLAIDPWGEVFVNGKSQGVSPPKKQLKLPPGKYKIEVRNSTFPPHVQAFELKSREELTVKHKFQ
jgi:hypothetical protein